jgi:hypothetical protein
VESLLLLQLQLQKTHFIVSIMIVLAYVLNDYYRFVIPALLHEPSRRFWEEGPRSNKNHWADELTKNDDTEGVVGLDIATEKEDYGS